MGAGLRRLSGSDKPTKPSRPKFHTDGVGFTNPLSVLSVSDKWGSTAPIRKAALDPPHLKRAWPGEKSSRRDWVTFRLKRTPTDLEAAFSCHFSGKKRRLKLPLF